jgi:hypothetical protein
VGDRGQVGAVSLAAGGGLGGFRIGGGYLGPQQVVDELVSEFAATQNYGVIGVEREAFGGVGEGQVRIGGHGLAGRRRPELGRENIAGYQLVTDFGVQVGADQRLLLQGFLFGGCELLGVYGVEGFADFLKARAEDIFRIIEHCEAAFKTFVPEVRPAGDGELLLVGDAGAVPHIRYGPLQAGIPDRLLEFGAKVLQVRE